MTFFDKYPQLKEKQLLLKMVSKSVFATMALENQTVTMNEIEEIVLKAIEELEMVFNI